MSVIVRNEYGAVAVNKSVLEKMIVEDLLDMSDRIILCNKKGKQIKDKPTPFLDPDYFDSVDITEKKNVFKVRVYIIAKYGNNISRLAEDIFERVENDFRIFRLELPGYLSVCVKGVMAEQLIRRNIEVVRKNS